MGRGATFVAGVLILSAVALAVASRLPPASLGLPFDASFLVVGLMMAGGLAYMTLPTMLVRVPVDRQAILVMLLVGLALRLVYLASAPVFEDDFYRYLWDGAAVAAGLDPFAVAPADVVAGSAPAEWLALGEASGGVVERVTYPDLRTIYPAVAQAVFLLAHLLEPWSLDALRLVLLTAEAVGLVLLLQLLRETGRSPLWAALYWWNPLIAKELVNSAHMDGILLPLVLGALLLAIRRRPVLASGLLALATAVKLWPVLLLPTLLRPWLGRPRRLFAALALFAAACGLLFLPVLLGALDDGSGFVAYGREWRRNAALFTLVLEGVNGLVDYSTIPRLDAGQLSRLLVAGFVLTFAFALNIQVSRDPIDLARRVLFITAALFLVSPTGYPWYFTWFVPLLAIVPVPGLLALTVMLPLYYLRFPLEARGQGEVFETVVVAVEFAPVLALLAWQALRGRSAFGLRPQGAEERG